MKNFVIRVIVSVKLISTSYASSAINRISIKDAVEKGVILKCLYLRTASWFHQSGLDIETNLKFVIMWLQDWFAFKVV